MEFDFTSRLERNGMDALAVNPQEDSVYCREYDASVQMEPIPMWIADMNFPTCPSVTEALARRVQHPAFGYFQPRAEYYDSIIRWQEQRNQVTGLTKECIGYENGVLGGIASALRVLCSPGDRVLMHAPAYVGFSTLLSEGGYQPVLSYLKKDRQGVWRMDFNEMERLVSEYRIHTAIFCSPHNPTGRVWERRELEKAMELFRKHDVFVISDEIWSDLTLEGSTHIPTQAVSEDARNRTIALYAPSKTFNLAGLVGSYHIISSPCLRDRVEKESGLTGYNTMNVLSMHALIGAYSDKGSLWVDELRRVLTGNVDYACAFISENVDGIEVSRPQGTYLLYLDCGGYLKKHGMTLDELLRKGIRAGVFWQDGRRFLMPDTIRMNLALPEDRVREAFARLKEHVF